LVEVLVLEQTLILTEEMAVLEEAVGLVGLRVLVEVKSEDHLPKDHLAELVTVMRADMEVTTHQQHSMLLEVAEEQALQDKALTQTQMVMAVLAQHFQQAELLPTTQVVVVVAVTAVVLVHQVLAVPVAVVRALQRVEQECLEQMV
jgi:hypothetical protein